MAAPNPYQYLKHGILLCKKNFATFVETFNFLVDFARNIKGDGENNNNGIITVDRTIPDRPVIRSKVNMAIVGGGTSTPGCFDISETGDDEGTTTLSLLRCYFAIGSKIYGQETADTYIYPDSAPFFALKVDMTTTPSVQFQCFASISEMNEWATDYENDYIYPLYKFAADGTVETDFRNMPSLDAWEYQ